MAKSVLDFAIIASQTRGLCSQKKDQTTMH